MSEFAGWIDNFTAKAVRKEGDGVGVGVQEDIDGYYRKLGVSLKGYTNQEKGRREIAIWIEGVGIEPDRLLGTVYVRNGKPVFSRNKA